jgi:hypothetical protein
MCINIIQNIKAVAPKQNEKQKNTTLSKQFQNLIEKSEAK